MEYKNFTSLPPAEEASFVIYEQTSVESGKKALTLGTICGAVVGILALVFYLAFDHPKSPHAVEPESELAEEPAPAAAPTPVEDAPAEEEPAAEEPAEDETAAAAEAPEPPKGATKAPPTALIGK